MSVRSAASGPVVARAQTGSGRERTATGEFDAPGQPRKPCGRPQAQQSSRRGRSRSDAARAKVQRQRQADGRFTTIGVRYVNQKGLICRAGIRNLHYRALNVFIPPSGRE
jgi:hypothetical protein